jgi:LmbE family N-acetylglucosaminyl deacetylase
MADLANPLVAEPHHCTAVPDLATVLEALVHHDRPLTIPEDYETTMTYIEPSPSIELPIPDAVGIYGFPATLAGAHRAWQQRLADHNGPVEDLIQVVAPLDGQRFLIRQRIPRGRPILAIEPHNDDLVLSASGMLLASLRPLTVVTVFTRSRSVHPALETTYHDIDTVTALRASEAEQSLLPLAATRHLLGHKDADPPYVAYDPGALEQAIEQLRPIVETHPAAELLAPAGVTRHPDHLLVHEAARRLGCKWFWEDIAFWPTYALSADDRQLFDTRVGGSMTVEAVDITDEVLDKLTLLRMHMSQMQPASAMYRPIRYAHTAARATTRPICHYAERFYRLKENP